MMILPKVKKKKKNYNNYIFKSNNKLNRIYIIKNINELFHFSFLLYIVDYRYWEDPSDEFRDEEGTLLPLWKFSYEKTKKMNVTDICFNTFYYDLFAVCFGSRKYL